jgi:hypothetical protein
MNKSNVSILGMINVPDSSVQLVLNITTVLAILFLLDLFFDINPVKAQYKALFPGTTVVSA